MIENLLEQISLFKEMCPGSYEYLKDLEKDLQNFMDAGDFKLAKRVDLKLMAWNWRN